MRKVLGICNLHDSPKLGLLTEKRPLAAVSFLGRYGLIDFTLSNFTNSGIDRVAILADDHLNSLRSHLARSETYIQNTRLGFQRIVFNEKYFSSPKFNTDIANILANVGWFSELSDEYVIVAPSFYLLPIDLSKVLDEHIAKGAEASIVYTKCATADVDFINGDTVTVDKEGYISSFGSNTGRKKERNISLEIFVFNRQTFIDLITRAREISSLYNIRDMVKFSVANKIFKLNAYEYVGYVAPILTLNDYVRYSFELLDYANRQKLFLEDWPIYTTTHNTPPSLYGENADVRNSFVANGSIINGKVYNSVISRGVVVEEGAELRNCIVFSRSIVGKGSKLKYVLIDKDCRVANSNKLSGDEENIVYVKQGVII